jgi:hypothetical protein
MLVLDLDVSLEAEDVGITPAQDIYDNGESQPGVPTSGR